MTKADLSLKKDILQLQKKVTDIELTATELREELSKLDASAINELKQKVEDVEDLTMVENAAVLELKKMLEGTQAPPPAQTPPTMPEDWDAKLEELKSRINALEEKTPTTPELDTSQIDELKTNFENLKTELEAKLSEVRTYVPNVDLVTNEIRREVNRSVEWLKTEMYATFEERTTSLERQISEIEEKASRLPSPEEMSSILDGITGSFKSFKSTMETRLKTEQNKLEEKWSGIEDKLSLLTDVSKSMDAFKSDMEMKRKALESIGSSLEEKLKMPLPERAVHELEKIRSDWIVNNARVDTIETLLKSLERQVDNVRPTLKKLETFDKLVDLHKELSEKLETMKKYYEDVMKFAKKTESSDLEKKIEMFEKNFESFTKRGNSEKYDDRKIDGKINRVGDDISLLQGNLMSLEQGRSDLTAAVSELQEMRSNINKRLNTNENGMNSLQKDLEKFKNDLTNVLKRQPKTDTSELAKKIDSLEAEINDVKSLKTEDSSNGLVKKINELERKIESIRSSLTFDGELSEVVSRLVFVESRLVAMEGMIQDTRYVPIVVE